MSSWSRAQLGWLKPKVVLPPQLSGPQETTIHLRRLDDPQADEKGDADRAALVVLPPKTVAIDLGGLPPASGKWALYSGQGNQLNRTAELDLDLRAHKGGPLELSFDAWWEIEGGWDFAYVETSVDGGSSWKRRLPVDRRHMPAKHGHDGKNTIPGFTGLSGDLDGDRKNESNAACDPKKELPQGEDKAGKDKSPCLQPSWVQVSFDLADLAGQRARIRVRYFTDMAAVMRGIMIDNLALSGVPLVGDFEGELDTRLKLKGFSKSAGSHRLLVPQYYLLEYRDPYGPVPAGEHRYDSAMNNPMPLFYHHPKDGKMMAVEMRPRPGVVVWYYNGDYAWSENDPAINGPGRGYALVVDANPNEVALPGFEAWYQGTEGNYDTHYDITAETAQKAVERSYLETLCFVRNPSYLPKDLRASGGVLPRGCGQGTAPVDELTTGGRRLMYAYQVANELLPGPARDARQRAGELVDSKTRKGKTSYRLRDRSLRYLHTFDAPFALDPFEDGVVFYKVGKTKLKRIGARPHPAVPRFDDTLKARWLNPKLPFGGIETPQAGFSFELDKPSADAPPGTQVTVKMKWRDPR
jgi:immune inhibitor A